MLRFFLSVLFLLGSFGSIAQADELQTAISKLTNATNLLSSPRDSLINNMLADLHIPENIISLRPCDYDLLPLTQKVNLDAAMAEVIAPSEINEAQHVFLQHSSLFESAHAISGKVKAAAIFTPQAQISDATKEARLGVFNQQAKEIMLHLAGLKFSKGARIIVADLTADQTGYALYSYVLFENGQTSELIISLPLGDLQTVSESAASVIKTVIEQQAILKNPSKLKKELAYFNDQLTAAMNEIAKSNYSDSNTQTIVRALLNEAYRGAKPTLAIDPNDIAQRYTQLVLGKIVARTTQNYAQVRQSIGPMGVNNDPFKFEWSFEKK